jgi:hypothetical protein
MDYPRRGPLDYQPANEPGWWFASDGKWYPPESQPGALTLQPTVVAPKRQPLDYQPVNEQGWWVASDGKWYPPESCITPPPQARKGAEPYLLIVAAALAVIGSFLPWISVTAVLVGTITKSGVDGGDGWFSIGLAVPLAIFGIRGLKLPLTRGVGSWSVVCSIALGGLTGYEIHDVNNRVQTVNGTAFAHGDVGVGLWLLGIGAVLGFVAGVMILSNAQRQR